MLELIATVQVGVIRRVGLPHFPDDLQPALPQGAQGAGVALSFRTQCGVVGRGPRATVTTQITAPKHVGLQT